MAATLRLMRLGRRGKAFYRIIVVDKRKKRTGSYIENIGTYNPLADPAEISYDSERFNHWVSKGAIVSEGLQKILKYKKRNSSSSAKKA
ncbi:30S ribosomal protein S16 [Candidatus Roizmanbacteria bacterium RIFCSPLOWO2_12_FULL_40_12]|uniref:Small ribosomal subunit protein bS16 n=1 Tax=Candidatus Roizmanbacteria bacterium RIFCSPLOWO2_01_FULL_40_42 TaxID=1802066 RepID=A0A1F7J5L8_9BACT|nr:MAG: 30S ribosomal protein S16 [Candidatus Roizmanbacteria bacterium RIFCSPHIGHO2_01_FULL_40_98]OGK28341.1 MAG: 30S ribosomal protein S16 [Candidatus Roizmanbacteria bacterium RIFCSPHIGHO2_02_FULL_40_53]OGK30577.1 MAG: 30S ribosomal protein S16 [Candidatus Roizmanbacteria bacterium RIFCSPHIGHO2_12_41_18]OGK36991.1 MAG: 30S ribosomal protein S16 [Candidatus Roizmanbacteria bacterium RIFCSPHIGHO2_12_FULL_40_130]OGK50897.1 MAG: 30S ribosomal protein S16 [Candidatus Roizmanbacteria bacterium RIF